MFQRLALISWIACTVFSSPGAWGQADADGVSLQHASLPADVGARAGVDGQRQVSPPVVHDAGVSLFRKPEQQSRDRSRTARTASREPSAFESVLDVGALLRRLIAGVLLSGALFVALLYLRTGKLRRFGKRDGDGTMELLDTLVLAPRCCLHLVRVHDQVLVVGRDAAGMQQVVPMHGSFESHFLDALPESSLGPVGQ